MSHNKKHDFDNVPIMWKPSKDTVSKTQEFGKYIEEKYGIKIENYWDLHKWSVENIGTFWSELWNYFGIIHFKCYDEVIDENIEMRDSPEWFKGAQLNIAENLLKYRDEKDAMILAGEDRETKHVSYSQMYKQACQYGAALRKLGLKKGDRVACIMSSREEPIFAMLGATAVGAIWMGALPHFGAQAVINRFQQTTPKFLFTIDKFIYQGEQKDLLKTIEQISFALPSLQKIIIVPSKPSSLDKDISGIKNSCFLNEFLSYALDAEGNIPELEFEQVSFSHPVFINYTSGTTGMPKAIMHGCGLLLNTMKNFILHANGTRDDVFLSVSPVGWASWNMFVTTFSLGSCLLVYEGVPHFLSPTSLWDLVDEHKISKIMLTASNLDDLQKKNYIPVPRIFLPNPVFKGKKNTLSSLKAIQGSSSVVKPRSFKFVYENIKPDVFFGSHYVKILYMRNTYYMASSTARDGKKFGLTACTECLGFCMIADTSLPIYRGEISAPALGVEVQCFDENGKSIEGEVGELVITKPSPELPIGLWNDIDGSKFRNTYFSKYSGAFRIGDVCLINPVTKGTIVYGRSDDTLKPKGTRFGSSEIYEIVEILPEIEDSLCVSQYNSLCDERAVLFLKLKKGYRLNSELLLRIQKAIEAGLSRKHVPDVILETKEIPYNMNGKKMEIIVKKIINGIAYNSETVINKDSLKNFSNIPQLKNF